MWGCRGVQCLDCKAEWNYTWHTENGKDLVVCPNCSSLEVTVLDQTVPFKLGDGIWPEHIYHCICGAVFQHPPKIMLDPFEKDTNVLKEATRVKCIVCGRNNQDKWYLPPEIKSKK